VLPLKQFKADTAMAQWLAMKNTVFPQRNHPALHGRRTDGATYNEWLSAQGGFLLRRSPNSAYFLVLNDRKIRHFVIILQAGYALFHGRISKLLFIKRRGSLVVVSLAFEQLNLILLPDERRSFRSRTPECRIQFARKICDGS
jgi:hypothetical protein